MSYRFFSSNFYIHSFRCFLTIFFSYLVNFQPFHTSIFLLFELIFGHFFAIFDKFTALITQFPIILNDFLLAVAKFCKMWKKFENFTQFPICFLIFNQFICPVLFICSFRDIRFEGKYTATATATVTYPRSTNCWQIISLSYRIVRSFLASSCLRKR